MISIVFNFHLLPNLNEPTKSGCADVFLVKSTVVCSLLNWEVKCMQQVVCGGSTMLGNQLPFTSELTALTWDCLYDTSPFSFSFQRNWILFRIFFYGWANGDFISWHILKGGLIFHDIFIGMYVFTMKAKSPHFH